MSAKTITMQEKPHNKRLMQVDRRCNIVVYGVSEEDRRESDMSKATGIVQSIDPSFPSTSIKDCRRLGPASSDSNHHRPLLVRLSSQQQANKIISKGRTSTYSITRDKSLDQYSKK